MGSTEGSTVVALHGGTHRWEPHGVVPRYRYLRCRRGTRTTLWVAIAAPPCVAGWRPPSLFSVFATADAIEDRAALRLVDGGMSLLAYEGRVGNSDS